MLEFDLISYFFFFAFSRGDLLSGMFLAGKGVYFIDMLPTNPSGLN